MADINPGPTDTRRRTKRTGPAGSGQPDAKALLELVELLFFAYRDFTGEADAVLSGYDFGRAHHRVLHFVNQRPGLRVADLLDILRITKQSLARVLKELVDRGFIVQMAGDTDRRERRLFVTEKGKGLADELVQLQTTRIAKALEAAGKDAEAATRAFLQGMIGEAPEAGRACEHGTRR